MNIEFEKQMGRNIRHIREEKGMTQELLSAKLQLAGCDITRSAVAKIEAYLSGRDPPHSADFEHHL